MHIESTYVLGDIHVLVLSCVSGIACIIRYDRKQGMSVHFLVQVFSKDHDVLRVVSDTVACDSISMKPFMAA